MALGTTVSISVYQPPQNYSQRLEQSIEPLLMRLDHRWRSFGDGELGLINDQLEQGLCADISPTTKQLVDHALRYRQITQALFDPTLGLDIDHWGFRDHAQDSKATEALATSSKAVQFRYEQSHDQWQICADQAIRLDLGGIAKGLIVKKLVDELLAIGVTNAIVNAGGDLQTIGSRGRRAWRIAIQHPRRAEVIATLEVPSGDAVFSSGDYYRYREANKKRIHHILNPNTRAPTQSTVAVTVIHSDPVLADVAATALFVAGPEKFAQVSQLLNIKQAMLIDDQLRIHTLPQFPIKLPNKLN